MRDPRKRPARVQPPAKGFRVDNKTSWSTADLRRFVAEVVRRQGGPRRGFVIEFRNGRQSYSSGRAYVGGRWCKVTLASTGARQAPDRASLALVIAHEIAHLRGLAGERDMRSSSWLGYRSPDWRQRCVWADALPLRPAAAPKKVRLVGEALVERRLADATAKAREWERKSKLAATKLKAWRAKIRYYEKRAAALQGLALASAPAGGDR